MQEPEVLKSKNEKMILSLKCQVCNSKKERFIKEQEASGSLSRLAIRTPLSKTPLLRDKFKNKQHN